MKCRICEEEGKQVRVDLGPTVTTNAQNAVFFDAAGALHTHDPNFMLRPFKCENDHIWAKIDWVPCNAPGCNWGRSRIVE